MCHQQIQLHIHVYQIKDFHVLIQLVIDLVPTNVSLLIHSLLVPRNPNIKLTFKYLSIASSSSSSGLSSVIMPLYSSRVSVILCSRATPALGQTSATSSHCFLMCLEVNFNQPASASTGSRLEVAQQCTAKRKNSACP